MTDVEVRLRDAFADARDTVQPHADLFARVTRSVEQAAARRRFRVRLALGVAAFVLVCTVLVVGLTWLDAQSDPTPDRRFTMPWWVIELITDIVLIALAVALGPFIKRFGRSYAADVFRANPRTGKSYLVLTDVAYYLIFTAYILLTVTLQDPYPWTSDVASQLEDELRRVGGFLLVLGVLHGANVVALPVIGRLLAGASTGRQGDES